MSRYLLLLVVFLSGSAGAESVDFGSINISQVIPENKDISTPLQVVILLTALSLAPAMLIVLTSFTRIVIVLSMLRHAFGMPSTPPNSVIISLSLFLTFYTMMPVFDDINKNVIEPYRIGKIADNRILDEILVPVRKFMFKQTREKDLIIIIDLQKKPKPKSYNDIDTISLASAFLLSELQSAFQIGFIIFLPFLAIDLIVASVLMSMGMIMVPPMTISLPLKILMFALIEGWALVASALIGSFK